MAERAAGGDWGPPAAPCRLSAPQPRASNLRPTSPWISRRSSLILRIARAHAGLRGSQLILLISELAHEGAQFHTNPRFRTQACDDHPDIQMMHLGEPPRAELVIRVVPVRRLTYRTMAVWVVPFWLVCSRLARLITRCLRPKGTKPAVSFP